MKFAWAMLLGGLMAGMAWGATPTEEFTVDSRVKTEQFRIRAKRLNTPIWRFRLKEGTNDWNATGWTTVFHYAPSVDSEGKIAVTGTVATATVDFTLPTNFLGRAMKDGYAAVTVGKDAEIVTYAWGRITIEPAPEISAEGALPMRRSVYGPDYGPFLGDFEHWPFSTNALEIVATDATLTGNGTAASPLSVVPAGTVTNATVLIYAGTNLVGGVTLDTDDFEWDGTNLRLKEYGWFADLAGDAGLYGRRRQGGTNVWELLGSMAEEAAADYGKLGANNTWTGTQTFNQHVTMGSGKRVAGSFFGEAAGSTSSGTLGMGVGHYAAYFARGNGWNAFGNYVGQYASWTNSAAFGRYAGRNARGNNRMYMDVYASDPLYLADGPTNDTIFMDSDGTLYLGGGAARSENPSAGGVLRGAWSANDDFTAPNLVSENQATESNHLVRLDQALSASVTPYAIGYAATVTVSRANGAWQSYRPTNTTTIAIENGGTGTVDSVRLDLWAGTNTVTFATNNVTYADFTAATNATTALLYDSRLWHTDWSAFVLELP